MTDLHLGSRRTIQCYDGLTRTGTVTYIHPEHRFAVLEFSGVMGRWRESFILRRPELEINRPVGRNVISGIPKRRFSVEEDRIVASAKTADAVKALGRSRSSILSRRKLLMERGRA
jgi:hypothetical protein